MKRNVKVGIIGAVLIGVLAGGSIYTNRMPAASSIGGNTELVTIAAELVAMAAEHKEYVLKYVPTCGNYKEFEFVAVNVEVDSQNVTYSCGDGSTIVVGNGVCEFIHDGYVEVFTEFSIVQR